MKFSRLSRSQFARLHLHSEFADVRPGGRGHHRFAVDAKVGRPAAAGRHPFATGPGRRDSHNEPAPQAQKQRRLFRVHRRAGKRATQPIHTPSTLRTATRRPYRRRLRRHPDVHHAEHRPAVCGKMRRNQRTVARRSNPTWPKWPGSSGAEPSTVAYYWWPSVGPLYDYCTGGLFREPTTSRRSSDAGGSQRSAQHLGRPDPPRECRFAHPSDTFPFDVAELTTTTWCRTSLPSFPTFANATTTWSTSQLPGTSGRPCRRHTAAIRGGTSLENSTQRGR